MYSWSILVLKLNPIRDVFLSQKYHQIIIRSLKLRRNKNTLNKPFWAKLIMTTFQLTDKYYMYTPPPLAKTLDLNAYFQLFGLSKVVYKIYVVLDLYTFVNFFKRVFKMNFWLSSKSMNVKNIYFRFYGLKKPVINCFWCMHIEH